MTTPAYIHKYKIGISGNIPTNYKDNYLLEEQDIINAFQDNRWIVGNRGQSCTNVCSNNNGNCSKGLSQLQKVKSRGVISTINTILKREANKSNLSCHGGYKGAVSSGPMSNVTGECYWSNQNATCNHSNTSETKLCCCPKVGEDPAKVCSTNSLDIKGVYDSVPDTTVNSQDTLIFQKNRSIFYSLKVLRNNLFNNILFNNDVGSTTNANYLDEINKLNIGVSGMINTNITNFKYDNKVDTEQLIKNIIRLKTLDKGTVKLNNVLNKYKIRIDKLKSELDNEYLDFKEKDNLNDRNSYYYLKELDKKNKVLKYIRVIFYIIIGILIIIILYNLFIKIKKKF